VNSTINSVYKYNAVFGRINYNYRDKYIVNLTARRDGSSRFGSENQFHNFGSAAIAWLFSNEKFVKNIPFLSFGKLRASYGTTGNDQIGDYQFMNLYQTVTNIRTPYRGITGIQPTGLPNPYLEWEETRKLQMGIDLSFFTEKVIIAVNYFRNRSSNQLLSYNLPRTTGFSNIVAFNFPATVQNSGWEFAFNSVNVTTKDFKWNMGINLTLPKNKLIAFPNLSTSSYVSDLVIGKPITLAVLYHYLQVDPSIGLYQFVGKDDMPTSSPDFSTDRMQTKNTSPEFFGGIQNSFYYKGFELDFLFQFVKQIGPNYMFGNIPGQGFTNQPIYVLNRWKKAGDEADIQKYSTGSDVNPLLAYLGIISSDAAYSDASYIRLKNLSLSWQLPVKWQKKIHLRNSKVFVQGQNLITITNYKGLDPETKSSTTLPPLRVLSAGVTVGF
jgi:TonB-dependent starch-binding outer membrane protein SusC